MPVKVRSERTNQLTNHSSRGFTPIKSGFTLIELLIVVAIIAVLTAVGIAVFGTQQKTARDARRKADINAIADAMEAKFDAATNPGAYAALLNSYFSSGAIPTDPLAGSTTACNGSICTYCATQGSSPQSPFLCTSGSAAPSALTGGNNSNWVVCANLETDNSGPGSADYYCRKNRQ